MNKKTTSMSLLFKEIKILNRKQMRMTMMTITEINSQALMLNHCKTIFLVRQIKSVRKKLV